MSEAVKVKLYKFKGKKYVELARGTGKNKGKILFKRVRKILWWYVPTKEPAFWLNKTEFNKKQSIRKNNGF